MTDRPFAVQSYISRIRGVPLLPGESLARVFSLREGLLDEPTLSGRLLVATNQRILFFNTQGGYDETSLMPLEELNSVVVQARQRGAGTLSWLKAILLTAAAVLVYLLVAYWLAGQAQGPEIPGINMDLLPFALLALILVGLLLYLRYNIQRPVGVVTLRGSGWDLSFACEEEAQIPQVHTLVETLFNCRQVRVEAANRGSPVEHS